MGKRRQRRQLAIIGLLATEGKPLPEYVISTTLYHLSSAAGDLRRLEEEGRVVCSIAGPSIAMHRTYGLPWQEL